MTGHLQLLVFAFVLALTAPSALCIDMSFQTRVWEGITLGDRVDFDGDGKLDFLRVDGHTLVFQRSLSDTLLAPPVTLPLEGLPSGTPAIRLLCDLNEDNMLDLVLGVMRLDAGAIQGPLAILWNSGNESFGPADMLSIPGDAHVVPIDLNDDQRLDLVISSRVGDINWGHLDVMLSLGPGTFADAVRYVTSEPSPGPIAAADFNMDGSPDIAMATSGQYLPNTGNGTFGLPVSFEAQNEFSYIVSLHLDGDNAPDLVLYDRTELAVLLNNGSGGFSKTTFQYGSSFDLLYEDLDDDGDIDFVVGESDVWMLWNNGTGTFTESQIPLKATRTGAVADQAPENDSFILGDFNEDGDVDIVWGGSIVLLSSGPSTYTLGSRIWSHEQATFSMDWDADGHLDLLAPIQTGDRGAWLIRGDGTGSFVGPNLVELGRATMSDMAVGDFVPGEGLDVITPSTNGFVVVQGNGDGSFEAPREYEWPTNEFENWWGAAVADFDHNEILDAAFVGGTPLNAHVAVYLNDGTSFLPGEAYAQGTQASAIIATDVDSDGWVDIVTNGWVSFALLLRNNGGSFEEPQFIEAGTPLELASADFNRDGNTDLAANVSAGINILDGNGDGTFELPRLLPVGQGSDLLALDVDDDGWPDLVTGGDSGIRVLLNDGAGGFQNPIESQHGITEQEFLAAADLDLDGLQDLVVIHNDAALLRNVGDGTFALDGSYPLATSTRAGVLADFTSDGKPDLIAANGLLFRNRTDTSTPITLEELRASVSEQGVRVMWRLRASPTEPEIQIQRSDDPHGAFQPLAMLRRDDVERDPSGWMWFLDTTVEPGHTYSYRLIVQEQSGDVFVSYAIRVETYANALGTFLHPIRNAGREIEVRYRIGRLASLVDLALFDVRGRRIRSFVRGPREAAEYVLIWDRTDEGGANVSAGVYVLRLIVDGQTRVRKTVLLPMSGR